MSNLSMLRETLLVLSGVVGVLVLGFAPIIWFARRILSPIDRAAKSRQAPVRFSIGDFLCLFLAIQIPLAAVHHFMSENTMEAYWTFTIATWLVAPVIWYAGARTLSKARVTTNSHRFVFLGLIMPLVYYGLVPFTALGLALLASLSGGTDMPFHRLLAAWFILAILFFASERFVRRMLRLVPSEEPLISDRRHENELFRAAMFDTSLNGSVHAPATRSRSSRIA